MTSLFYVMHVGLVSGVN